MDFKENTDRIVGDIRKGLETLGMMALLKSVVELPKPEENGNGHVEELGLYPTTKVGHVTTKEGRLAKMRRLQGRYVGAVRPLSNANRKKVAKIREAHGYVKAIAKAKQLQA